MTETRILPDDDPWPLEGDPDLAAHLKAEALWEYQTHCDDAHGGADCGCPVYDPGGHGAVAVVPACCRCEEPVTGTPVTDPDDPLHRQFCSEECLDAAAEAYHEQRYTPR